MEKAAIHDSVDAFPGDRLRSGHIAVAQQDDVRRLDTDDAVHDEGPGVGFAQHDVSAEEVVLLDENKEFLASLGFSYEAFGERSFLIREVPLILANTDQKALFLDIAGKLSANRKTVSATLYEELLYSMACRAAIKANDSTSVPELTALLHTVIGNDEIRHCPHGRPIVIAFDKSELERRFGRIQ